MAERIVARAEPGVVEPVRLRAVADAFVMLGLLSQPEAEAALQEANAALAAAGLPGSVLSVRSGARLLAAAKPRPGTDFPGSRARWR